MQKRYRLAYWVGTLLLTTLLILSTLAILHFVEGAPAASHRPITFSLLNRQLSNPGPVRIMPLGDSITAGIGTLDHGGYREPLWEKSVAAGWNISFVGSQQAGPDFMPGRSHEGHPGWRVDQISGHVVGWLDAAQPQVILLHIGTNDIIQGYSPTVAANRLAYLLQQITATLPDSTIIVAQIIPLGKPSLNARVLVYNRFIPLIVHNLIEQGRHVSYVDMYDAVPASDLRDHIHPDASGYALMANVWFQALKVSDVLHKD